MEGLIATVNSLHNRLLGNFVRRDDEEAASSAAPDPHAPQSELRVVFVNRPQPIKYTSNRVSTAKYNLISFLPLFLFEQFRRYSNCFFLFIALLQQIPDVSPTGRYTTLMPLLFILFISAIKEVIEDIRRHAADRRVNVQEVEVLKGFHWQWIRWSKLKVGDVVRVRNDSLFPADLVLLSSSEPNAMAYVETSNLDGETNLKVRQGLGHTSKLLDAKDLNKFISTVECEPPNRHLYDFVGNLREQGKQPISLGPQQILLRGAKLRNTSWVFGVVTYTGHETKLMKNSSFPPLKRSTVDKVTNMQILWLFLLLLIICLISAIASEIWSAQYLSSAWYLGADELWSSNFGYNLLTFIILYNNLIPISLQVTIEVVRLIQATLIGLDADMYHEETNMSAMARTSNLNEELGQVKYILTDKTGTLTKNVMEFRKCSVAGKMFSVDEDTLLKRLKDPMDPDGERLKEFMVLLAVCHTVIPEHDRNAGEIKYQAASPDERALVSGARRLGYVFTTRTPHHVAIDAMGATEQYEVLNVLEFTSDRKRMSVIVRTPSGEIKLYAKGADTVIYERLSGEQDDMAAATLRDLEIFATEGLRTLCYAVADISEDTYMEWSEKMRLAQTALHMREQKVADAADLIEQHLVLLGATGIEDKLQDQVPETIAAFMMAGIHVWILTGDKQETAINIAYSCKLIDPAMALLIINEDSLDATRETLLRHVNDFGDHLRRENHCALIIDGRTLKYALSHDMRRDFLDLCISCRAVVCCRVSPIQKAEVVDLLVQGTDAVTLAVGDGANDVAMIQRAHVGVGVSGQEGMQAVCNSDYAVAQFRFLRKLLFVHGNWCYHRMCKLILYSFYKNICLYVIELWYAIWSAWSGQTLFERWCIGLYNVLFTAAPPLALGLFDRVSTAETMLKYPALYKMSQESHFFNNKIFWLWVVNALVHSILLFWLPAMAMSHDVVWPNGKEGGYLMLGNSVYTYVVVTVCLKAGLETSAWTVFSHLAIWGSIAAWFLFLAVYSNFWPSIPFASEMAGMETITFSSLVFWLGLILFPVIALLGDVIFRVVKTTVFKTLAEAVRESEIQKKDPGKVLFKDTKHRLTETARLLKNVKNVFRRTPTRADLEVELAHGYAFSQEEHGVVPQSEVIRAYDTTVPKPGGM